MASRTARLVRLLTLLALLAACTRPTTSDRVETRVLRARFTSGRLAHQPAGRPCDSVHDSALVARSRCEPASADADEIADVVRIAHAATPGRGSDTTIDALHSTALVELRWGAPSAAGVDHAVDALERAARRAPTDVVLLNDLAVVQLARAEREQQLWPLLQALDAVERAREASDTARPVLFNRALILERLYLTGTARRAWGQYLAVEHDPAWRREAQTHLRRLAPEDDASPWPTDVDALIAYADTPALASLTARVRGSTQPARESGLALLGAWGSATLRSDTTRARRALAVARALGGALDAAGGDRGLGRAVQVIDLANRRRARALARAHADYSDGYASYGRGAYERAALTLARAADSLRELGSPSAAGWAAVYRAVALINLGEFATADGVLRDVLTTIAPAEPALRGRAVWVSGLSQGRRGGFEAANRYYREALIDIARAREQESLGTLSWLLTEGLALAGQSTAARDEALRALRQLAHTRRSGFLASLLGIIAGEAGADGMHRPALDLMDEVLDIASAVDKPQLLAWAHGERARDFAALGSGDSTRAELAEAARWSDRLEAGHERTALRAAQSLVRGRMLRATDPRAARDTLLRVVDTYRAGRDEIDLPNAMYQAALASRDAGDTSGADRLLVGAIEVIEGRRTALPTAEVRASFYEAMENVFDAMIALELDRGRADVAFAYLERERAAAWRPDPRDARARRGRPFRSDDVRARSRRGDLTLEYALLRDRLVIWALTRDGLRPLIVPVGRDSVAALVRRFDEESTLPTAPDASSARAALFDLLIRPVAREVAGTEGLAVIPDRELSRVPFAALWDRDARRNLVETHTIRTLPSAAFVGTVAGVVRAARIARTALVVGDPAVDPRMTPQLVRLPGAAQEAASVARMYDGARLLSGPAARHDSLLALLPTRAVFHFAGHAVVNAEQPELSYLALAADGTAADGVLRASEIGRLRLSNLMIAVLSACSTLNARPTHVGAIAGLAYSFLRAGAPAIVSSLWDVDDGSSTSLLVAFHRHLAAGVAAPEALRAAQIEALRSGRPALRAPRTWAAFVYTGP